MNKTKVDALAWWGKISTLDKLVAELSEIDLSSTSVLNLSTNKVEKIYKNIFSIT